jgi:hypothetical protein
MSSKPMLVPDQFLPSAYHPHKKKVALTFFQRAILRRGHPRHIIARTIGSIWAFYFLWQHNWSATLAAIAVSGLFGRLATWTV